MISILASLFLEHTVVNTINSDPEVLFKTCVTMKFVDDDDDYCKDHCTRGDEITGKRKRFKQFRSFRPVHSLSVSSCVAQPIC